MNLTCKQNETGTLNLSSAECSDFSFLKTFEIGKLFGYVTLHLLIKSIRFQKTKNKTIILIQVIH